jgi:hypothetical protein
VPYRNIRPRYDGTNYGGPTLSQNDTGRVDAVNPLPKISEEDLVNWQHAIGALPSNKSYELSAPTVEKASTTLIDLLKRLIDNTPPSKCIPISRGCYNTVRTPTLCKPDTLDRPCYFPFNLLNLATPLTTYAVRLVLLTFVPLSLLPCYLYDTVLILTLDILYSLIDTFLSILRYISTHVFVVELQVRLNS